MAAPSDLRRFFDARKLTEQELGMIEFVLTSPAYDAGFRPYLESVRESMREIWLDRSRARKDLMPDDYLAGMVASIDGLLTFFNVTIHEANADRIQETMASMTSEKQYELMRKTGQIRPIVGADQSAVPDRYDPLEDI